MEHAIFEDEENADDINSEDEDDDDDYDCHEFGDSDLYDSKLDSLDEVLYFRDTLVSIQNSNS